MIKIGIIGSGFTGLATAYYLSNLKNSEITILESEKNSGGLAKGFKMPEWEWYMDDLIHHWFTSDKDIFQLIKELGLEDKLIFKNTTSSCYYRGKTAELDSPLSLLKYPFLPLVSRIRMGLTAALLKLDKNYLKYEKYKAYKFLEMTMGKKGFEIVWKPLFIGKFGKYFKEINATWFWARLHFRTKELVYIEGGFQFLINVLTENIKKSGVKIVSNSLVNNIEKNGKKIAIKAKNRTYEFDIVVATMELPVFLDVTKDLPPDYIQKLRKLKIISSQYFVLELEKPFLEKGIYWLNISEEKFPFMMVTEHTNFVDKMYYDNKHLIWVGKYLDEGDELWKFDEKKLLEKIIPYLKKINPEFEESWIKRSFFKRYKYSQPIIETNYSSKMPGIKTPIENLYMANMFNIYPEDRGTNQAVALGKNVAELIKKSVRKI